MTGQDWVIIGAGWLALAAVQAGAIWDRHCDSRRADRHRDDLNNHARRLLHVEAAQRGLPTTTHAPMPVVHRSALVNGGSCQPYTATVIGAARYAPMPIVTKVTATISGATDYNPHTTYDGQRCAQEVDATLRLSRPPARSDIEHLIAKAGRCLTATELATQLDRRPWDLLPDIEQLLKAGKIETVPGHTAGRTAYRLAGDTLRMAAR